jgi:hypothetical protein
VGSRYQLLRLEPVIRPVLLVEVRIDLAGHDIADLAPSRGGDGGVQTGALALGPGLAVVQKLFRFLATRLRVLAECIKLGIEVLVAGRGPGVQGDAGGRGHASQPSDFATCQDRSPLGCYRKYMDRVRIEGALGLTRGKGVR